MSHDTDSGLVLDGTVTALPIAVGDQVANGALLLTIEETDDGGDR